MHRQYYQKAIAAYFAAFNAFAIHAQEQMPFVIPGDGGTSYLISRLIWKAHKQTVCFRALPLLEESPTENALVGINMRSLILLYLALHSILLLLIGISSPLRLLMY
jgi:hypothetical protein